MTITAQPPSPMKRPDMARWAPTDLRVAATGPVWAVPRLGAWVRCERSRPAAGSWRHYVGRVGRIVSVNVDAGEFGVAFTSADRMSTWFELDELVVIDRPADAPDIKTRDEREEV